MLNCSCDFIGEIKVVINGLHNLDSILSLLVALGGFIKIIPAKVTCSDSLIFT